MYNRILKRPMFKRGGSSYQSQGTGITSPYDTPRKRYAEGPSWEEINERRSNIFQPRSEMDFAAEGFSALGNPYDERTGEAKTIGEMLYEGATGVRKSRAADKALGQSAELANIESDADRLSLQEKFERDKFLKAQDVKIHELKPEPWGRRVMKRDKLILSTNTPDLDSYDFTNQNHMSMAIGEETIIDLQNASPNKIIRALVMPASAYTLSDTGEWKYSVKNLVDGMVYYEPTEKRWLVVDYTGATPKPIFKGSYEEAESALMGLGDNKPTDKKSSKKLGEENNIEIKNNEITMKITSNLQGVELTDAVVYDEAAKAGIKIVENIENSKTFVKNLAKNEMLFDRFKELLQHKKTTDTAAYSSTKHSRLGKTNNVIDQVTEEIKVAEMATGGRAGYASGTEPDDNLSELTSWWKSEVDNSFNS